MIRLLPAAVVLLGASSATAPALSQDRVAERAAPARTASLWWCDWDGDGRVDAFVVNADGSGRLLHQRHDGAFEDVTESAGLPAASGAHMAAWGDADGDGRFDLFLPARRGESALFLQTEEGTFRDVTQDSGLPVHAEPLHAAWLDVDGDGLSDLHLVTEVDELVYRNSGDGRFAKLDLGIEPNPAVLVPPAVAPGPRELAAVGVGSGPGGPHAPTFEVACAIAINDQANPPVCIEASTIPTFGLLYPLSNDWFVDSATGNVGIGTITPGAALDVVGDARVSGQFISTVSGSPPLVVASADLVANLNADLLDGLDSTVFATLPVTGADVSDGSLSGDDILDESLSGADVADGSLSGLDIGDGTVTAADLGIGSVGSDEVADNVLRAEDLATASVDTDEIIDGAILAIDLAVGAVGSAQVLDDSLTASDLAVGSVESSEVLDNSLRAEDLAVSSVDTAEIVDGAIVDVDVSGTAAIAGTKIFPNFGSQDIDTTGSANIGFTDFANISVTGFGIVCDGTTAAIAAGTTSGSNTDGVRTNTGTDGGFGLLAANFAMTGSMSRAVHAVNLSSAADAIFAGGGYGGTGAKYFINPHPTDPMKEVRMVCLEGNESGTYFRGTTHTFDGTAVIEVPEVFRLASSDERMTVQTTAIGAPATLWVESRDLERIVVRSDVDVEFDYFVNGVRRGYEELELIRENTSYIPSSSELGKPYGTQYPDAQRQILVQNGILNADFTPNEATLARMMVELEGYRTREERARATASSDASEE